MEDTGFQAHLRGVVWVIKILKEFQRQPPESSIGTGFSVDKLGHVMTCAHLFSKQASTQHILLRKINENGLWHEGVIVYQKPSLELVLLKVQGIENCDSVNFCADGSISAGEPLFHMGNPQNFVGTFATGHCLFPCKNVVVPSVRLTCAEYESQALARIPEYRIMGDIWNMESFPSGKKFAYEKELNPLIPIIQMSGLVGGGGSSGGPVFNTNQELVGMLVMGADGFEIAIHVSMLKQFLKDAAENSKIGHDDEAGSSKKPKTGSSKKLQRWGHNI